MESEDIVAANHTTLFFQENNKAKFNLFVGQGGTMTQVPKNFVLPTMGLNLLITNQFCGDVSK